MKWLLRILFLLVAVFGLVLGALLLMPGDKLATILAEQVRAQTGRDLKLTGDVNLSFWPVLGMETGPVTFGNAPWAGPEPMLSAQSLAVGVDATALISGDIDRIVFTRPAVESGNSMGFLPGKLEEKFDPYFTAFKSCLISNVGKGVIECAIKNGNISVEPLAYMRGKTFNRAFVVLDEAQNCTPEEMKMFMTRIGKQSTIVINGDLSQSDIRCYSGLHDAIKRIHGVKGVYVHEFEYDDIVRSDIVKDIIMCYDDDEHKVKHFCTEY